MVRGWWAFLFLAIAVAAPAAEPARRGVVGDCGPRETPPAGKVTRQRWAQARMDEMANERLRCRERFRDPRQVQACEAGYERRFRVYNEMYLEAARE
ncbi:MAG TPA: hypothetical protein VGX21_23110 [Methylomirabilota bacterium]|jgi:hypothetical protein|nr:hypothetical protein [Methylomirabilota bacterium]